MAASRIFRCRHFGAAVCEGKCYCPDCGTGLIYEWVVLRCQGCQGRREHRSVLTRVWPRQRFCKLCGELGWVLEKLDSPACYQLANASLLYRECDMSGSKLKDLYTILSEPAKVASSLSLSAWIAILPKERRLVSTPL